MSTVKWSFRRWPIATSQERCIDLIYDQLRDLAWMLLRSHAAGSVTPTDLVHEAFLKISSSNSAFSFESRDHAVRTIVRTMRHVLVDRSRHHATERRYQKRTLRNIDWDTVIASSKHSELDSLDEALSELTLVDARAAEVVQLRFFGGLTTIEIAQVLHVNEKTVRRDWTFAQAWLHRSLSDE